MPHAKMQFDKYAWQSSLSKYYYFPEIHIDIKIYNTVLWPSVHILNHDDVIKWKHFPRYWPIVRGIHRSPVNSSHKGHWRRALWFCLICDWTNGRANNRNAVIWDAIALIMTSLLLLTTAYISSWAARPYLAENRMKKTTIWSLFFFIKRYTNAIYCNSRYQNALIQWKHYLTDQKQLTKCKIEYLFVRTRFFLRIP